LVSLLVMLSLAVTGGLMYFVLPPGTGHFRHLFGLGRHDFGQIHSYLAAAVVALVVLHLVLHWGWICGVVAKARGRPTPSPRVQRAWGWALLLGVPALTALGLWWASAQVEQVSGSRLARGEHAGRRQGSDRLGGERPAKSATGAQAHDKHAEDCPAGATINGRATLSEAAKAGGLTVQQMRDRLGLPASASADERLGRLKRRHGLEIHAVREIVCEK
jgi:hypothetical protein